MPELLAFAENKQCFVSGCNGGRVLKCLSLRFCFVDTLSPPYS